MCSKPELVVDVAVRGREIKAGQEQSHWHALAANGGSVHDFKLGDGFAFIVHVAAGASALPAPHFKLHVLDLQPD